MLLFFFVLCTLCCQILWICQFLIAHSEFSNGCLLHTACFWNNLHLIRYIVTGLVGNHKLKISKVILKHAASWKVQFCLNRIVGVLVSVLAFCAVDRWFEPRSVKTNDCKIGICCFSAKHVALRKQPGWFGIRMYRSGATCLPADCRFSELAL